MIDSYDFGIITIDGKHYTTDVVIFPDRVQSNWWRREGHQLRVEDIEGAVAEKPEVLIVGTGYHGLMEVMPETRDYLESRGIQVVAEKTGNACKTFNELVKSRRVIAALHLTC